MSEEGDADGARPLAIEELEPPGLLQPRVARLDFGETRRLRAGGIGQRPQLRVACRRLLPLLFHPKRLLLELCLQLFGELPQLLRMRIRRLQIFLFARDGVRYPVSRCRSVVPREIADHVLARDELLHAALEQGRVRTAPQLMAQDFQRGFGSQAQGRGGEERPEGRQAEFRCKLRVVEAPALGKRLRESVGNGDRGGEVLPLEGQVEVLVLPERKRPAVRRRHDRAMQRCGEHEFRRNDAVDEGKERLPALRQIGPQDGGAPALRQQFVVVAGVVEVRHAEGAALGRWRRLVERRQEHRRVADGHGLAEPQRRTGERPADGKDLAPLAIFLAQARRRPHAAAPEDESILDAAFFDRWRGFREEEIVDAASDDEKALALHRHRNEELVEQKLREEVAEVALVADARPVKD